MELLPNFFVLTYFSFSSKITRISSDRSTTASGNPASFATSIHSFDPNNLL
jgi:hypothetical protein